MIVSISGRKLNGKDATASVLIKNFNFTKISLADPIKTILSSSLNIPLVDFYDQSKKELPLTDFFESDTLFSSNINKILTELEILHPLEDHEKVQIDQYFREHSFTSLRDLMQQFGTDCCRTIVCDDIWLKINEAKMSDPEKNYVCPDSRFANEREFFKKIGGKLWFIERPNFGTGDGHISENQLGELSEYDVILKNDKTLKGLTRKVNKIMKEVYGKDVEKAPRGRKGRNSTETSE